MTELQKELQARRDQLRQMADEIRVKLHLAGMEAKDKWHELEPKLADFERRVESVGAQTGRELHELAEDLKARMTRIRDRVRS